MSSGSLVAGLGAQHRGGGVVLLGDLRRLAQPRVHHRVGEALGQHVEAQHREQDQQAGVGGGPPSAVEHQGAAVGDDVAPAGGRVLDAGAQEGQGSLEDDGVCHHHGGEDQHRGRGVAHHVAHQDVQAGGAEHLFGADVVLAPLGHDVGADHAGQLRDVDDGNGHDDHRDGVAQGCQQHRCQRDAGEGHDDIHDAHDRFADPLGGGRGDRAKHRSHGDGQGHGAQPNHQRGACAVEQARVDVAAQPVGAKGVGGTGCLGGDAGGQRVVRGNPGGEDGGQGDDSEEEQGGL